MNKKLIIVNKNDSMKHEMIKTLNFRKAVEVKYAPILPIYRT